ncbi:MAG: hypothetical protein GXO82_10120 [Chlorobi bacterium]|nr:hypothetical protein [Chlorobiota bacterium]
MKKLWWLVPISIVVSLGASLFAVWLLGEIIGLSFDSKTAAIVGMLTAAASGTCLTAVLLLLKKESPE